MEGACNLLLTVSSYGERTGVGSTVPDLSDNCCVPYPLEGRAGSRASEFPLEGPVSQVWWDPERRIWGNLTEARLCQLRLLAMGRGERNNPVCRDFVIPELRVRVL